VLIIYTVINYVVLLLLQLFKFSYVDQMHLFQARRTPRKNKVMVWFVQTFRRRDEGTNLGKHFFSANEFTNLPVNASSVDMLHYCYFLLLVFME
jgi:hypothetical protein